MRLKVRREFTANLERHQGEYIDGVAHAVRCVRGQSLQFQVNLLEPFGGAGWLLPIEALVWKPCARLDDMKYVQPWDCFSSEFGVCELDFVRRGGVEIIPARVKGQYRFSLDFAGTDLAEDPEQHKALHICYLENGVIGAFPNNRVIWHDSAFWDIMMERPDFESLNYEARAEGNQHLFRTRRVEEIGKSNGQAETTTSRSQGLDVPVQGSADIPIA